MTQKTIYYIEVTDTFGGECNYCWLSRYRVKAKSERGAMRVIGKEYGFNLRNDGIKWQFKNAAIAAYVVEHEIMQEDICRYAKLN